MSSVDANLNNAKEWAYEHRGLILAAIAAIAALLLILALTLSWFLTNSELSTVAKVDSPATLKVLGPNETFAAQLDLTYDDGGSDKTEKDANGNDIVVRRRAFCVESNNQGFELQVANTTNINGLKVKVYRVTVNDPSASGDVTGTDAKGSRYSWSKSGEVGGFQSIDQSQSKTATFLTDDTVQEKSNPLYRYRKFETRELDKDANGKIASATNFILECTWPKDSNMKESDIAYLIARQ